MPTIAREDVEKVIDLAVNGKARVLTYTLEAFSQKKNGVLGSHILLSVDIEYEVTKDVGTRTFFAKAPPESGIIREIALDDGLFEEEVNFYKDIQPLMLAVYHGTKWSAKCYLAKKDLIVLEDLRVHAFSALSEPLMDEVSLKSALATLARFHASSLLAEAKLGKSLKQAYPKYFAEKTYATDSKFGRGTLLCYETIVLMAEKFGLDASLVLPRLHTYVRNRVVPEEGHVNVVCHGDLWKNNVMFDRDAECIIVDYQLLRYASPAVDVTMLIYLNSTPEFRESSEMEMLEHYYFAFEQTLRQSGGKLRIPTYDYTLKEYLSRRLVGMTYAAAYLPGIYLKADDFARLLDDPEAHERYFLHDRMGYIGPEIDSNSTYANLMKSILIELLNETSRVLNPGDGR